MRIGLSRDECMIYTVGAAGEKLHDVTVDIPVAMQREIKTIEKAFWSAQATLEKLYERAKQSQKLPGNSS